MPVAHEFLGKLQTTGRAHLTVLRVLGTVPCEVGEAAFHQVT